MNHFLPSDETTNREIDTQNEKDLLTCWMRIGMGDSRVKPADFVHPLYQCFARAIQSASPTWESLPDYVAVRVELNNDKEATRLTGGVGELEAALIGIADITQSELIGTVANRELLTNCVLKASVKRKKAAAIERLQKAHATGKNTDFIQKEINELDERLASIAREPTPVPEEIPPEKFPIEAMPDSLRSFASECSRVISVPIEMASMCCLAVASAAIGSRLKVKSINGKTTSANIMVLIGAESGSGKSETFRECIIPFEKCAASEKKEWKDQVLPSAKAEARILDKEIKTMINSIKEESVNRESLKRALAEKEKRLAIVEEQLKPPVFCASDFTTPELIRLLCRMDGQMFAASPDAKNFVDMVLGRYNEGGTDEEVYLKGFSLEPIDRHRVGDGSQETPEACITGLWLTQPDKIERLVGERALSEGGLLPRLLTMLIHCQPFRVSMEERGIGESTRAGYDSIITELFQAFRNQSKVFTLDADTDARQALVDYHNALADRREHGNDLSDVTSFAARWGEYAWRVSLICHAVRHGEDAGDCTLCLEDAQAAIAITEWAASQQLEVLRVGRDRVKREKYDRVLEIVREKGEVIASDVYRANITPRNQTHIATALLEEMEAAHLLRSAKRSTARKNHTQTVYHSTMK